MGHSRVACCADEVATWAAIYSPAQSLVTVSGAHRPAFNVCEMRGSTLTKRTRDRLGFQRQTNPTLNTVTT